MTTVGVQPGVMDVGEHFRYMPVLVVVVLLVVGIRKLLLFIQERKICSARVCRIVLSGIFLFLMLTTVRQSIEAQSAYTMFRRSLDQNPNNARIQYSMGLEMAGRERFEEAEQHFRRALSGNPYHMMTRVALGRALHDQGRFAEGIAVYETVHGVDGKLHELLKINLRKAKKKLDEIHQRKRQGINAQEYIQKTLSVL